MEISAKELMQRKASKFMALTFEMRDKLLIWKTCR